MPLDILFEDAHVIAVAKPAGQLVIPGRGNLEGEVLAQEVGRHVGHKVFVVHRLDRAASGIVLFAKDAPTHRHLSIQFEKRLVKKTYQVLVQGHVAAGGRIDQPLGPFGSGRMGVHAAGKSSVTDYSIREALPKVTLLDVMPLSGRRHQIRVHFYSIGHPVIGDPLYGKDRPVGGAPRLMLHACMLDVEQPDGTRLVLEAPLPTDFKDVLASFR